MKLIVCESCDAEFKLNHSKIVLDLVESSGDYSFATNFLSKLKLFSE